MRRKSFALLLRSCTGSEQTVRSKFTRGSSEVTAEHLNARKVNCVTLAVAAISLVTCQTISAQTKLGLKAIGKGERVRLSYKGRSKATNLEKDFAGAFVPGGDPPHRYTVLLSVERNSRLYLVAKFRSRSSMSEPMGPCGGDTPSTLLLIKATKDLKVKELSTEIYDSCAFNEGRHVRGKPKVTREAVTLDFQQGNKLYTIKFDANRPDKKFQVSEHQ